MIDPLLYALCLASSTSHVSLSVMVLHEYRLEESWGTLDLNVVDLCVESMEPDREDGMSAEKTSGRSMIPPTMDCTRVTKAYTCGRLGLADSLARSPMLQSSPTSPCISGEAGRAMPARCPHA
jgi:hypothetical protein